MMARAAVSATIMSFSTKSNVCPLDPWTIPNFPTVVAVDVPVVIAVEPVNAKPLGLKPGAITSLTYATNEPGFRFVRTAPGPGGM